MNESNITSNASIGLNLTSSNYLDGNYISRILPSVVAMSILFVLSAVGNVTVFSTLVSSPMRKTRISTIILHLTISDLIVTFLVIPSEVIWRLLRFWLAGNLTCKIFAFLRAFGFLLSSMVLIVVCIDRYIAVIHPLKANSAFSKRGYSMLGAAWAIAALCSVPQLFTWSTRQDPDTPPNEQCVTFGSHPNTVKIFSFFFLATVYFIPLVVMIAAYSRILVTIVKKSKIVKSPIQDGKDQTPRHSRPLVSQARSEDMDTGHRVGTVVYTNGCVLREHRGGARPQAARPTHFKGFSEGIRFFSRTGTRSTHFSRARARTLRMTVLIVLAFICCWTPNVVMSMWFLLDQTSAEQLVDPRLADVLFILTITNSVVNPYVYGSYASEMRGKCLKWCSKRPSTQRSPSGILPVESGSRFIRQRQCQRAITENCNGDIKCSNGIWDRKVKSNKAFSEADAGGWTNARSSKLLQSERMMMASAQLQTKNSRKKSKSKLNRAKLSEHLNVSIGFQLEKKSPSIRYRFPIRTIRQTRFGALTPAKRNLDLRRSRSLSHIEDSQNLFQGGVIIGRRTNMSPKKLYKRDFKPIYRNSSSKRLFSCDKIMKKSKSMVDILGNHKQDSFLSEP